MKKLTFVLLVVVLSLGQLSAETYYLRLPVLDGGEVEIRLSVSDIDRVQMDYGRDDPGHWTDIRELLNTWQEESLTEVDGWWVWTEPADGSLVRLNTLPEETCEETTIWNDPACLYEGEELFDPYVKCTRISTTVCTPFGPDVPIEVETTLLNPYRLCRTDERCPAPTRGEDPVETSQEPQRWSIDILAMSQKASDCLTTFNRSAVVHFHGVDIEHLQDYSLSRNHKPTQPEGSSVQVLKARVGEAERWDIYPVPDYRARYSVYEFGAGDAEYWEISHLVVTGNVCVRPAD